MRAPSNQRLKDQLRWLLLAVVTVALLGFGAGWLSSQLSGGAAARRIVGDRVEDVPGLGRADTTASARCGLAEEPVSADVHDATVQAGGVVILYRPGAVGSDALDLLRDLVADQPTRLLVAPDPTLGATVRATVVDRRLLLDAPHATLLRAFVTGYAGSSNACLPPEPGGGGAT